MHETKSSRIKGFIESNVYVSSEKYVISGWVADPHNKISYLDLRDKEGNSIKEIRTFERREDVSQSYSGNESFMYSGFSFQFKATSGLKHVYLYANYDNLDSELVFEIPILEGLIDIPSNLSKINQHSPDLVVVDDFYENPDEIRKIAMSQNFESSDYHKGKRTKTRLIVDGTKEEIERILGKKITSWNQRFSGVFQYCTAEDPIVYHTDSQSYAAVVYLTPDAPVESGTSFWRSKKNGLWRNPKPIDMFNSRKDYDFLRSEMFGNPPNFYDGTRWELVDRIGNRYNRLAIWNAQLVHSATEYFGLDINDSRLFHMFFFDCE